MSRIAPDLRAAARGLRAQATPEERKLWRELRELNRRIGTNFRRQAPIGRFIVDFADYGRRIVIELDGGQHAEPNHAERDAARDGWLAMQGFRVVRVWNADLHRDFDRVMNVVLDAVGTMKIEGGRDGG